MATKTNMERAKHYEKWFWIASAPAIASLFLGYWIQGPFGPSFKGAEALMGLPLFLGLFFVGQMTGCAFRGFRALKQEIADLKSGDSDNASVTESTDPPDEGSPTPESD